MKMNYLMKGMAVMALGLVAVSCNKMEFSDSPQIPDEVIKENAEAQLGIEINPNQTWQMTQQATASVEVNMGTGKTYNYVIYSNDPLSDRQGISIAKGTVTDGGNINAQVTCPSANTQLVVSLTDADNITYYKRGNIEDNKVSINFTTATTRSVAKRAITVNGDAYDKFPSTDEVASQFPTSIPAGSVEYPDGLDAYIDGSKGIWDRYAVHLNYIGKEGYKDFYVTKPGELYFGNSYANPADRTYNIYINVDGDLTIKRQGAEHVNFYILKGNVTIDGNCGECGGIISVAKGATVNDQRSHIAHNDGIKVFNRGTYNAVSTNLYWNGSENVRFDIGNFCTFYNEGKFTCDGALSYSPGAANTSYFVNLGDDAELTAASMTLNSAGNFFNSGKATITGETKVTKDGIYWVNNGYYTTGSMTFSAKNTTFYNYCQLKVTGNAHMYDGELNLMDNSYTEAGTAEMRNFIVNMGSKAGMYIKGTLQLEAQGDGTYQGFRTNASGNSLRVDGTITVASHKKTLSVSKGITFAHNAIKIIKNGNEVTEAELKKNSDGDYPVLDINGLECTNGSVNITPSKTNCGGSAQVTPDPNPVPVVYPIYSYAFEDTKVGDYDMNDVVIKAQETKDGKINLKVVACGATLNLNIRLYPAQGNRGANEVAHYEGTPTNLSYNGQEEVHAMLGAEAGAMVNTGSTATAKPITITIDKGNHDPAHLPLAIYSTAQGEIRLAGSGQAPFGVIIPEDWSWPTERVCITSAYNKTSPVDNSFTTFAGSAGAAESWYKYPTGSVMNEKKLGY